MKVQPQVPPIHGGGKILLVTPVWKDATRLAVFGAELAETLANSDHDVDWLIADDGSGSEQKAELKALQAKLEVVF
ncbi:MAG: hypothetical protein QNL01_11850, partial [Akkermansiaceae bacterium]